MALALLDGVQPSQARRKRLIAARLAAVTAAGRAYPRMRGLEVLRAARRAGTVETLKSAAGMLRRLVLPGRQAN